MDDSFLREIFQPGSIPNVLDSKGILNKKPGILLPIYIHDVKFGPRLAQELY